MGSRLEAIGRARPESTSRWMASLKVEKPPSGTESGIRSVDGDLCLDLLPEGEREVELSDSQVTSGDRESLDLATSSGGVGDRDQESRVRLSLDGDHRALLWSRWEAPRVESAECEAARGWALPQSDWGASLLE